MANRIKHAVAFVGLAAVLGFTTSTAADETDRRSVSLSQGHIRLTAPEMWVKKTPRTRIVQYEFAIPAVDGDKIDARITLMGAGGSVQQNIDRWIGQFKQPDGSPSRDKAKIEKKTIADQEVHFVDVSGTYADRRGPFAPAKERNNFRMLGAIIVTQGHGQHFVKMYGPKNTIKSVETSFHKFLDSLVVGKNQ